MERATQSTHETRFADMIKQGTVGFDIEGRGEIKGTRGPTEYFGEIALIEGGTCTATAIAQSDCELYELTKTDFDKFLKARMAEALDPLHIGLKNLQDAGGYPHMISAEVGRLLKEFDEDGDGQFSVDEVEHIVTELLNSTKEAKLAHEAEHAAKVGEEQAERQAKQMKYVAAASFVALLAVCASMFAMTLLGNEISKDVSQSDNGLITVKGTNTPVQVGSSDFQVGDDGVLIMRPIAPDGSRRALSERGAPATIATDTVQHERSLTSDLPVEVFHDLQNVLIADETGISVNFKVLGAGRMPAPWAASGYGFVMVIHTVVGRAVVDGNDMYLLCSTDCHYCLTA
jgi:hypothetical protein